MSSYKHRYARAFAQAARELPDASGDERHRRASQILRLDKEEKLIQEAARLSHQGEAAMRAKVQEAVEALTHGNPGDQERARLAQTLEFEVLRYAESLEERALLRDTLTAESSRHLVQATWGLVAVTAILALVTFVALFIKGG